MDWQRKHFDDMTETVDAFIHTGDTLNLRTYRQKFKEKLVQWEKGLAAAEVFAQEFGDGEDEQEE